MPSSSPIRRLTWILFAGQSIGSASYLISYTVGAIVGAQLGGRQAYSGLPGTLYLFGSALAAYPAARLMERAGRRLGLSLGFLCGAVGGILAGVAFLTHSFLMLLIGFACMGMARGVGDLARFAAAEMHPAAGRARAISQVVFGGAIGAIIGPALTGPAGRLAHALGYDILTGPWFASATLYGVGLALMALFLIPDPRDIGLRLTAEHAATNNQPIAPARPVSVIMRQSGPTVAILSMALAQLVMAIVMAMTPLYMKQHNHSLDNIGIVLAGHSLGMFGLSMFSGRLADNFGRPRTIILGGILLIAACLLAPLSTVLPVLTLALFLLGLGWNLCAVAGAALLTDSLAPAERAKVQGSNDLLVGLISAIGSLGSGVVFESLGYGFLSGLGLALALIPIALAVRLLYQRRTVEAKVVISES
jgi:MFS family permease